MMNCPGRGSRDGTAVHRANQDDDPSKGHPGSTEAGGGGGGATVRMGSSFWGRVIRTLQMLEMTPSCRTLE